MFTISKLPAQLEDVIAHNSNLRRYLDNLAIGKQATPRSWLYENIKDPNLILQNWLNVLSSLEKSHDPFENTVFEFEQTQLNKWGPQGQVAPMHDLLSTIVLPSFEMADRSIPKAYKTEEWRSAQDLTLRKLLDSRVRNLRPLSVETALKKQSSKGVLFSNSGWPMYTRRNIQSTSIQAVSDAQNSAWLAQPAISLFRNYNQKTRLVWMFPFAVNLVEATFFLVLQASIMASDLSSSYYAPWRGFDSVRRLIHSAYSKGKVIAASDFSATDAHFQFDSSSQVISVLEQALQPAYRDDFRRSLEYMHKIPLVISSSEYIIGPHGVSSGSNWTNFIETVFDQIFSSFVQQKLRGRSGVSGLYAIGDDMTWIFDKYDDAFAADLQILGEQVGQDINASKTHNDRDKVVTLQRLFQRGYNTKTGLTRAVYPTIRALKSSVFPERWHNPKLWDSDMFCARQFMILENCVDHPLFYEFVKFVCNGQRDLIPFAKQTATELDRIQQATKRLPGLNPTYNQEKSEQSLSEFESIQIAKTL